MACGPSPRCADFTSGSTGEPRVTCTEERHLVADVVDRCRGRLIDETIAYITGDTPCDCGFATAYEITDQLPFSLKRLRALLREREVGVLTVKKRGSAVEPEELRRRMKLKGPHAATVFLTRVTGAPAMLIGHPVKNP